jgi:hypothetical protein
MFRLFRNRIIAVVFKIEIIMMHPNINLLFRKVKITTILLFQNEDKIVVILLNFNYHFKYTIQTTLIPFIITSPFIILTLI